MFDLFNHIDLKRGLSPVAAVTDNTAFVSQIIDLADTEGAVFAILTGSLADADATFTVLVESGAVVNLSDATATPDDQLLGTEALASFVFSDDDKVFKIGVRPGYKRYARVTITPANNGGNAFVAGLWISNPKLRPANNPPT